ncbi:MAG: HAMP domain-containing histidine kinase [Candidatus Obscuribacterales bacterium]|nr:HAMP domain-containing histidine kinase [Candidatus Obscuribacterales bacterium]
MQNSKAGKINLRLTQKALILVAVPLLFELVSFTSLFFALESAEREIKKEQKARSITQALNQITMLTIEAPSLIYSYNIKGGMVQLEVFRQISTSIKDEFAILHKLLDRDPAQQAAVSGLEAKVSLALAILNESRRFAEYGDFPKAFKTFEELKTLTDGMRKDIAVLSEKFREIERKSPELQARQRVAFKAFLIIFIFTSIILAAGLYVYFTKDTSSRLEILLKNTLRFGKGEALAEPLSGTDELADLDSVFHKMAESIARANREKQEFVAMITHDIRSPLTSMLLSMSLVSEGTLGDQLTVKGKDLLERCQGSVNRVVKLINDLLDVEKLEAGMMKMLFENTDFQRVIDNSVETLIQSAEAKQVKIISPKTTALVYADGDRYIQVLVNLLSNAIKYSPEGGKIEITLEEGADYLKLYVQDEGPGIPEANLESVFDRFQQVDSAERKKYGGTGLGLAICKEIVKAHHGEIGVLSKSGEGSKFWFTVPRRQEILNS